VAEVQTPSDTTYRVTDWGRGRDVHVERSMECIHFHPPEEDIPGRGGSTLLETDYFSVASREAGACGDHDLPPDRCTALMFLTAPPAGVRVIHEGDCEPRVEASAGDTILVPAGLKRCRVHSDAPCSWLEITLPESS
jgi:mannose-6-phosphate isomerase